MAVFCFANKEEQQLIPMVEYLLQSVVRKGLNDIKQNPEQLDNVFRFLPSGEIENIKQRICSRPIPVIMGFPRDPAQMPCYSIILGQEMEEAAGLGMDIGDDFFDSELESSFLKCKVFYDMNLDRNYIELTDANLPVNEIEGVFDAVSKSIKHKWKKGENRIFITDESVNEGDMLTVSYEYYLNGVKSIGSMFNINYRIECWSENGDLTVYMYHILKYIMLRDRKALEGEGVTKSNLSGGDLEPVPEYFPNFIYRRTLIFGALVDNTIESEIDILQSVTVKVTTDKEGEVDE